MTFCQLGTILKVVEEVINMQSLLLVQQYQDFIKNQSLEQRQRLLTSILVGFSEECLEFYNAPFGEQRLEELADVYGYLMLLKAYDTSIMEFTKKVNHNFVFNSPELSSILGSLQRYLQCTKRFFRQDQLYFFEAVQYAEDTFLLAYRSTNYNINKVKNACNSKLNQRIENGTLFNKGVDK